MTFEITSPTVSPCFTASTFFKFSAETVALRISLNAGNPSAPKRLQNLQIDGSETCALLANCAIFSFTTNAGFLRIVAATFLSDFVRSVSAAILSKMFPY